MATKQQRAIRAAAEAERRAAESLRRSRDLYWIFTCGDIGTREGSPRLNEYRRGFLYKCPYMIDLIRELKPKRYQAVIERLEPKGAALDRIAFYEPVRYVELFLATCEAVAYDLKIARYNLTAKEWNQKKSTA